MNAVRLAQEALASLLKYCFFRIVPSPILSPLQHTKAIYHHRREHRSFLLLNDVICASSRSMTCTSSPSHLRTRHLTRTATTLPFLQFFRLRILVEYGSKSGEADVSQLQYRLTSPA